MRDVGFNGSLMPDHFNQGQIEGKSEVSLHQLGQNDVGLGTS